MGQTLPVRKADSIADDLQAMENRIRQRAYEIFSQHGFPGKDLDNWLMAEGELAWQPSIELREKDTEFVLNVAVPGVDPKAIAVEVTPEVILVKASLRPLREDHEGAFYASELKGGDLFRAVRLPRKIDPDKVKAKVENGMLQLIAGIANEATKGLPSEVSKDIASELSKGLRTTVSKGLSSAVAKGMAKGVSASVPIHAA